MELELEWCVHISILCQTVNRIVSLVHHWYVSQASIKLLYIPSSTQCMQTIIHTHCHSYIMSSTAVCVYTEEWLQTGILWTSIIARCINLVWIVHAVLNNGAVHMWDKYVHIHSHASNCMKKPAMTPCIKLKQNMNNPQIQQTSRKLTSCQKQWTYSYIELICRPRCNAVRTLFVRTVR